MITITIESVTKHLDDALSGGWLAQQIERRRAAGMPVCVKVHVQHHPDVDMVLATPGCPAGGGGRPPRRAEKGIFDYWEKCGLDNARFTADQLISFLRSLRRLAA